MIKGLNAILLSSGNAKKLAKFYEEVVGLKIREEYQMGEKESAFEMAVEDGSGIYINDHSEVKGKSKEPQRIMFNFEVDNIEEDVKRLKEEKVKVVTDTYHIEGYGLVATFEDIDGNYFQLVQVKAN